MKFDKSPENFCRIWQESETLADVCETLGYEDPHTAVMRAYRYRTKGIKLKKFKNISPLDRRALNRVIKEVGEK